MLTEYSIVLIILTNKMRVSTKAKIYLLSLTVSITLSQGLKDNAYMYKLSLTGLKHLF